jgi:hypothetical protein
MWDGEEDHEAIILWVVLSSSCVQPLSPHASRKGRRSDERSPAERRRNRQEQCK